MNERDRRFPAGVYGHGEEPDPRFSLANERTFLAWIRTSLAFAAAAIALKAIALRINPILQNGSAAVMAALSVLCAVQAWRGWMATERSLRSANPLPGPSVGLVVVVGLVVCVLGLMVGIFV